MSKTPTRERLEIAAAALVVMPDRAAPVCATGLVPVLSRQCDA